MQRRSACLRRFWFNDEDTLRKAGSKTDMYEVFKRLLSRGQVPSGIKELLAESVS